MPEFTGEHRQAEQAAMIASGSLTAEAGRLFNHFDTQDLSTHAGKWAELWDEGWIPWDRGSPSLALVDLLQERRDLLGEPVIHGDHENRRKRALVPGCGRGYDVLLLSACGYDACGLDYSGSAIEAAKTATTKLEDSEQYRTRNEELGKGAVNWIQGDFFSDFGDVNVKWDLIYDYTFLCALPPELRASWSKRILELLSPTGRVICLEYPTYKPPSTGGPPWACPSKVHLAHLQHPGEDLPYENGDLQESRIGPAASGGLERIAHFQPKRTHRVGYDAQGNVIDMVSVWARKG